MYKALGVMSLCVMALSMQAGKHRSRRRAHRRQRVVGQEKLVQRCPDPREDQRGLSEDMLMVRIPVQNVPDDDYDIERLENLMEQTREEHLNQTRRREWKRYACGYAVAVLGVGCIMVGTTGVLALADSPARWMAIPLAVGLCCLGGGTESVQDSDPDLRIYGASRAKL